jgi:hypothetical protein
VAGTQAKNSIQALHVEDDMKGRVASIVAALAGLLVVPAEAQDTALGPLVELSRPNAVAGCDTGFNAFGSFPLDDATETFVAVNPIHPNNIVAAWIQGPFQDIIAAVSLDGGQNWQRVPIPLTVCSGGPYPGTGDPKLSFAPNGDLYAVAGIATSTSNRGIGVSKSTDGGLHWSVMTVLPGSFTVDAPADFPWITADPTDARFVYVTWNGTTSGKRGPGLFSRTTDGGLVWEPARAIIQTDTQSSVASNQIMVMPDGTLVAFVELLDKQPNMPPTQTNLLLLRSIDRGKTWSAPINAVTATPLYAPNSALGNLLVFDPKTGQLVFDLFTPSAAIDSRNGNLYAAWEDGRFSNFQNNDIAFSMSADRGLTWSAPIRVNQTPLNILPANRTAFLPIIAVAADGTIGVTYYDFRFNSSNPGLPTDYWLVQCRPSSTVAASNPACWGSEVRLTNSSFNMEAVSSLIFGEFFVGDYLGLATAGDDFISTFTQVDNQNVTSIFARRVGP